MEKTPLYPGTFYHIFNHAVGSDNLFGNPGNYDYFLEKYVVHITPIAHTFAYCLMPNHLHLIVRIKEVGELVDYFWPNAAWPDMVENMELPVGDVPDFKTLHFKTSKVFGNLFSAYSQAFNKQQGRRRNLFISNFKRKELDSVEYLLNAIAYAHFNPVHHDFTARPEDWPYSSFLSLLSDQPTNSCKEEVFMFFGGKASFMEFHGKPPNWTSPPEFFGF